MLPCRNTVNKSLALFIIIIIIIIIIILPCNIVCERERVYMWIGSRRHKNCKAALQMGQKGHCEALRNSFNATKR